MSEKEIKTVFGNLRSSWGTILAVRERNGLIKTYEDVQLVMTVSATVVVAVASVFVFWRDVRLRG